MHKNSSWHGPAVALALGLLGVGFEEPTVAAECGWNEVRKTVATDAAAGDGFGRDVSISGDRIVVGASEDDDAGSASGSAYVLERNAGGADNWGEVKKLTASDATAGHLFGFSVSIGGDTVVVGAYGSSSGSAYVFQRNAGGVDNWGEVQKLTASDALFFGVSVAIDGDTIVVGAVGALGPAGHTGAAYVFERNAGGADNWGQVHKLTAPDGMHNDHFGVAVSISGDTVVVGASEDDTTIPNPGSAYVFERSPEGAWGFVRKLTASDGGGNDYFGSSVTIDGDTVAVGAPRDNTTAVDSGSAYVFERNAGGMNNWGQVKKLTAADAAANDRLGLLGLSISGDTVVAGAYLDDGVGADSGSAYVFERDAGGVSNWGQVQKLTSSDAAAGDSFGWTLSISGDTLVTSARYDDDAGTDSGSAYVFDFNCHVCGDGLHELGEDCDDMGESASCDSDCTLAACGDSALNVSAGEVCDDGNIAGGDGCAADCSVVATGVPGEASPGGDMLASPDGSSVDVTFSPSCAATDHAAYWGLGPIDVAIEWVGSSCGLGTTGTASFDPDVTLLPDEWLYFVVVGYDGQDEGSHGVDSSAAERPEAVGIGACDRPAGTATCE